MFCIGNLSKGSLRFVCDWATSWSLCRMATTRRLRHWHRTLKKRVRVLLRGNQLLLKGIQCYPMLLLCLCSYVRGHIQSKLSNLYNVCLMKTRSDICMAYMESLVPKAKVCHHGSHHGSHHGEEFTKVRRATTSVKFQLVWVPRKHRGGKFLQDENDQIRIELV